MIRTFAALLCFFTITSVAQDVAVTVSVKPYEVYIGDPVEIVITITALKANSIKLDPLPQGLADGEILSNEDHLETGLLGEQRLTRTVLLVPFTVGKVRISPLHVEVILDDGTTSRTTTPLTVFNVRSVAPGEEGPEDTEELKDIIDAEEIASAIPWIAVIVAALILMGWLIWWFFFRSRAPRSIRDLMKLTPAQRALHELKQLAGSGLLEAGNHQKYYTILADILRRYLGLRYHIFALEMTSTELRERMERIWDRNVGLHGDLASTLDDCDLVKFAQFIPDSERGPVHIETIRRVIESTRDDLEKDSSKSHEKEAA